MTRDPFPVFETLSLTQLGQLFGESSHMVGRWLKECGVRHGNGAPTDAAIKTGLAEQVTLSSGGQPFWAWNKEKAIPVLAEHGHRRPASDPSPAVPPPAPLTVSQPTIVGPFQMRLGEDGRYEVLDSRGTVVLRSLVGSTIVERTILLIDLAIQGKGWYRQ